MKGLARFTIAQFLFLLCTAQQTTILFGNVIADATIPAVDFYINGTRALANVSYTQTSMVEVSFTTAFETQVQVAGQDTILRTIVSTPISVNETLAYFVARYIGPDDSLPFHCDISSHSTLLGGPNLRLHHQALNAPALYFTLYDEDKSRLTKTMTPLVLDSSYLFTAQVGEICFAIARSDGSFFVPGNCWTISASTFYDVILIGDYNHTAVYPVHLFISPEAPTTSHAPRVSAVDYGSLLLSLIGLGLFAYHR